ncbi:MAG: type IV pilus modification PilV family protein [Chthoniobacterales bacterium]
MKVFSEDRRWKMEDGSTEATQLFSIFTTYLATKIRTLFKCAEADAEQGTLSAQSHSVYLIHEDTSTEATQLCAASVAFKKGSKAFTLFEVLIALAVFAFSVAGLVMALDSMVKAVLETRERVFSRLSLESRLAYNLVDPPVSGDRTLTNHGVTFTESLTPLDLTDVHGNEIRGIYRLKITSEYEKITDSAEILLYRPE